VDAARNPEQDDKPGRIFTGDVRVHGGDNVAESGLTFDRVIDRQSLTPRYGSGWQPA
jgi:hypothetical protein